MTKAREIHECFYGYGRHCRRHLWRIEQVHTERQVFAMKDELHDPGP